MPTGSDAATRIVSVASMRVVMPGVTTGMLLTALSGWSAYDIGSPVARWPSESTTNGVTTRTPVVAVSGMTSVSRIATLSRSGARRSVESARRTGPVVVKPTALTLSFDDALNESTPDLPTTNSVPGTGPVSTTLGGVTLPTASCSVSGTDALPAPSTASATTCTSEPIGTKRGVTTLYGIEMVVTALVNVVSNARVTPPVMRTWLVLSPRSSFALTVNARTPSAGGTTLVTVTAGPERSTMMASTGVCWSPLQAP